jgi:hypothetical protein
VVAPTVNVPRAHPCAAWEDQAGRVCAATPAWLHRRVCVHEHYRDLWLCHTHEAMIRRGRAGSCRDCGELGHRCPVALVTDRGALDLIRAGF